MKSSFAQLLRAAQDNFWTAIVVLHSAPDLDLPALELVNVAKFFQIGRKYNDFERTDFLPAEVQKLGALAAIFYLQHRPAYTLIRAHVLARVGE